MNKKYYIVIWRNFESGDGVFVDIFFTKAAAALWIAECTNPDEYEIECYQQGENGRSKSVTEF